MNMNNKILSFIIVLISFFFISSDVYALCGDASHVYGLDFTDAQCGTLTEDGFKCTKSGNQCVKSSNCVTGYNKKGNQCVKDQTYHSTDISCSSFSTKDECGTVRKCEWRDNSCLETYVAELPCTDDNIKTALRFFGYLLLIAKIAIPLIIIIMGTFDLFKSVIDKDEKSFSKQMKMLMMRIIAGVFIFFIPNLIYAIFGMSKTLNIVSENTYDECMTCIFKPTECSVKNGTNN